MAAGWRRRTVLGLWTGVVRRWMRRATRRGQTSELRASPHLVGVLESCGLTVPSTANRNQDRGWRCCRSPARGVCEVAPGGRRPSCCEPSYCIRMVKGGWWAASSQINFRASFRMRFVVDLALPVDLARILPGVSVHRDESGEGRGSTSVATYVDLSTCLL